MPGQPLRWRAEALRDTLLPLLPGLSVEVVHRTASTNSDLLARARVAGAARHDDTGGDGEAAVRRSIESAAFGRRAIDVQPALLVAEQQTAGRGRNGRDWQSEPGASLTFSLAMPLDATDWSGLSLAVGVALAEALDPSAPDAPGAHIGLKWPNDLWLMDAPLGARPPGRKLGGILIETLAAGRQRLAVIGVGLNVLPFEAPGANTGFAALQALDPAVDAPTTLARVARPLLQAVQQFGAEGFAPFAVRFAARDLLDGRRIRTTLADAAEGTACGVSPTGALRVRSDAGRVDEVRSGEVSVRLAPAG